MSNNVGETKKNFATLRSKITICILILCFFVTLYLVATYYDITRCFCKDRECQDLFVAVHWIDPKYCDPKNFHINIFKWITNKFGL